MCADSKLSCKFFALCADAKLKSFQHKVLWARRKPVLNMGELRVASRTYLCGYYYVSEPN